MTRFSTYNKRKPERKRSKARAVALDFFFGIFFIVGVGAGVCSREESTCSHAAQEAGAAPASASPTFNFSTGTWWVLPIFLLDPWACSCSTLSLSLDLFFFFFLHLSISYSRDCYLENDGSPTMILRFDKLWRSAVGGLGACSRAGLQRIDVRVK